MEVKKSQDLQCVRWRRGRAGGVVQGLGAGGQTDLLGSANSSVSLKVWKLGAPRTGGQQPSSSPPQNGGRSPTLRRAICFTQSISDANPFQEHSHTQK